MPHQRLLPASGAVPTPGQDIAGTRWQELMRPREIALFCFDAQGRLLKLNGQVPDNPISEYCVAYRSRFHARVIARGQMMLRPGMLCTLYSKSGKWLETVSAAGVRQRNEGLRFAWLLLQFPLTMLLGLGIMLAAYLVASIFQSLPSLEQNVLLGNAGALALGGLLVGAVARGITYLLRIRLIDYRSRPGLEPFGSPGREAFYKGLNPQNLLVPEDISVNSVDVQWPEIAKYEQWTAVLRLRGFTCAGTYSIPQVASQIEFWSHAENGLTAAICNTFRRDVGMWLAATTQYPDGSSFGIANKNSSGIDQHPQRPTLCIGPDKTAEEVLDQALALRPTNECVRLSPSDLAPNFVRRWKEYIQWRHERGTTIEEFKRIDEQRVARLAKQD